MSAQRKLIKTIRRLWGIDLPETADADMSAAIGNFRRQFGNALELVSDQLYSSKGHFLLELLQNADDCDYPKDIVPTLSFHVVTHNIAFHNNEVGFSPDEVRALCGLGESTKKGRKEVKTGEKGIGFKAVFMVSDRPEVHSNGFHFRFNREAHGILGLVIPEWIETLDPSHTGPGTSIILPLRADTQLDLDLIRLLRPELLLFLRRLRAIGGGDERTGAAVDLARKDDGHKVEITRQVVRRDRKSTESHRFFIHRRTVNMEDVIDGLRADLRETDVVVAFPLSDDDSAEASKPREIFSFLPVMGVGFHFIAHADFVLSTSREAVIKSRPWNIRLRSELGLALADAILEAEAVPPLGRSALRFLTPPRDIADEFMRGVLTIAIERLKGAECVPTLNGGRSKPDAVLRPDDSGLSGLVKDSDLERLLGRRYVAGDVGGLAGPLDLLDCERFGLKHVLECCQVPEWLSRRPAKWFGRLLTLLAKLPPKTGQSEEVRNAPILRLADGQSATPAGGTVFQWFGGRIAYGFEHELRILDKAVFDAVAVEYREGVRRLLAQLNVREPEPQHIIDDHILPLHRGSKWKDCREDALLGHVRYVRDNLDDYLRTKGDAGSQGVVLSLLQQHLWIRNSSRKDGNAWFSHAPELYLGRPYEDPYDLRSLFGERIGDLLVGADYVRGVDADARRKDSQSWSLWLLRMGAHVLPRLLISNTAPPHLKLPIHTRRAGVPQVTDWVPSEELLELMSARDPVKKAKLLSMFDEAWAPRLADYGRGRAQWQHYDQDFDSTWLIKLHEMEVQATDGRWVPLQGCFLETKENHAVFGEAVPYIAANLKSRAFLEAVGVVLQPEVEQVIARLDQLRQEERADRREIKRLYKYLDQRFEQDADAIAEAFTNRKIVYLDLPGEGGWVSLADCCWHVPTSIRRFAPALGLSGAWRDLEEFFCQKLGVRPNLTADEWVHALQSLRDSDIPAEEIGDLARQIYRQLNELLNDWYAEHAGSDPHWLATLRTENLLWTTKREWWRNDDDVFVADDPLFQQPFEASTRIAFVDLPSAERPRFARLLEGLNVGCVSERIKVVELPRNSARKAAPELEQRLRERWLHLARLLFHKHRDAYRSAMSKGFLPQLGGLPVCICAPLMLTVELLGERAKAPFDARLLTDGRGRTLFVDESSAQNWDPISIELGRGLEIDDSSSLVAARVFAAISVSEIDKLFSLLRVPPLPEDERRKLLGEKPEPAELLAPVGEIEDEVDEPHIPGAGGESPVDVASAGQQEFSVPGGFNGPIEETEEGIRAKPSSEQGAAGEGDARPNDPFDGYPLPGGPLPAPPVRPDSPDRERVASGSESKRLISYVKYDEATQDSEDRDTQAQEHRERVDDAAIKLVLSYESLQGRSAHEMPHNNEGYDVESGLSAGQVDRYIEVKGLKGQWGERGVTLSRPQYEFARERPTQFWLYVVEHATDPERRRLYLVPNPAEKVTHYGFDHGWQAVAELTARLESGLSLCEGARYRLPDGREGVIHSIARYGQITELKLTLPDGSTARHFGPEGPLSGGLVQDF